MDLPIKLVSTDFDGTIFAEFDDPPTPPTLLRRLELMQQQGVRWVINTGRDLTSLMESMARAKFHVRPDFLVTVEREIHILQGHEYVADEKWNARCEEVHDELFARVEPDVLRLRAWIQERFDATLYHDDYSPLCLLAGNANDTDAIMEYLEDYARSIPGLTVVRNDVYARLSHADYNKGKALAEIARRLGISTEHIFAAGDHLNDVPMLSLEYAKFLCAPKNAIESIKELVRSQNGYVSHQSCGKGIERALEFFLQRPP